MIRTTLCAIILNVPNVIRRVTEVGELNIAAIALQHNLIIVSADSDFQRICTVKELSVKSWL